MSLQFPHYAEIDIRRPNGEIETVNVTEKQPQIQEINADLFARIKAANATRGSEVLCYRNYYKAAKGLSEEDRRIQQAEREYKAHYNRVTRAASMGERHT